MTAVTLVCSVWLGEASVVGGKVEWCGQGFGRERKRSSGRRIRLGFVVGLLSVLEPDPRHELEQGEAASDREKGSTASRWPPAHGEDEDDFVPGFF
jgi:hypothetical protein